MPEQHGATTRTEPAAGFNLLAWRPVRGLILWWGFPYIFQLALLAVFLALAVLGWGHYAPAGVPAKLFAKSNLVTLLVWGLWWPLMVWGAVWLGRAWCMVCPLELVSNVAERLARRLGLRQRVLGPWLAGGAAIVALFAALQLFVAAAQLHRTPAYTSWMLLGLLLLAVVSSLLWKDRAFCRGFCPAGLLLATYGRSGMLAVRAGPASACAACAGKECLAGERRFRPDARSCPSLLNPPKLNSNRDCLVCGQCLKACAPDNMRLLLRPPFARADAREPLASWPVTLFVMLASGFVMLELCTEWKQAEAVFLAVPTWLSAQTGATGFWAGVVKWVWTLLLVPAGVWLGLAGLLRLCGERHALADQLRRLALPLAVVVAAGHMSKGLAKFVAWLPFLPGAWREPDGVATAQALTAKQLAMPAALLTPATVSVLCLLLMTLFIACAVREHRLAHPDEPFRLRAALPVLVLGLLCAGIIAGWASG